MTKMMPSNSMVYVRNIVSDLPLILVLSVYRPTDFWQNTDFF